MRCKRKHNRIWERVWGFIFSVFWHIEYDLQWCGRERDSFEMGCYIKMHTRYPSGEIYNRNLNIRRTKQANVTKQKENWQADS